jgi:hypothetical protein
MVFENNSESSIAGNEKISDAVLNDSLNKEQISSENPSKSDDLTAASIVHKWRWTRPLGYLDTFSNAFLILSYLLPVFLFIYYLIFRFFILWLTLGVGPTPFIFTAIVLVLFAVVFYNINLSFLVDLIRIFSYMGIARFLRVNKIDGKKYISKSETASDSILYDACVIKEKPVWLALYFPNSFVDFCFSKLRAYCLFFTLTICAVFLDLFSLNIINYRVLTFGIIGTLIISFFITLHVLILDKIYTSIINKIFDEKVYKDFN